ncbi:patatin-like phospholipase family protein [Urechidicola croceus]|uniref:PNPLA domain-containing protein n=1 Tax=Urechidicola croceus TaxID=1850246 RepID=A0A1D8P5D1_9FLAO|nr:patatin-like phospholipase family protein [Urechidicola croceus]AOW19756.1 hypothetical protein LPB138_03245 [Urechidicola croceus]
MDKLGLALSGGGIRGVAHLGVLQYLTELGIKPSVIACTSAGSLAGAFYAAGFEPEEIFKIGKSEKFFSFSNLFKRSGVGLFSTDVFENIIKKYISHNTIESLDIQLYITATDLTNAKLKIFSEGSLGTAIKASCCIPLVFQPVLFEGAYLTDGGILNNFPVNLLEGKVDKIIGINVNKLNAVQGKMGYKRIIERTVQVAIGNSVTTSKNKCNLYIEPPNMHNYRTFDFKKIDEIYKIGYEYAQSCKKELLKL